MHGVIVMVTSMCKSLFLLCQLTYQSADITASFCGEQLLQKYKAQRHAVSFKRYLIYQG